MSVDAGSGVLYMKLDGEDIAGSSQAPYNHDMVIDRNAAGDVVGLRYLRCAEPLARSDHNPDARLLPGLFNAALDQFFWGDSGVSLDDELRYLDGEGPGPWAGRFPYLFILLDGGHFAEVHRAPLTSDVFIGRCTDLGLMVNAATEQVACDAIRVAVDVFLMNHPEYVPCPNCGIDFDTGGACHRCTWSVDAWYNGQPFNASSAAPGHSAG